MNPMIYVAVAAMVGAVALLTYIVRTSRVQLPLLMDTGITLLALGIGAWMQPLLGDDFDTRLVVAARALFLSVGAALVAIAWGYTLFKRRAKGCPMKRAADSMAGELGPMERRTFPPRQGG